MEGRSFYLRYRPRRFDEVIAQEPVTRTLRNAVARDTVAHAYLLCGPRGTGKTSIARILYRVLNCLQPREGEPCGECASCRAVDAGSAVDLIEMDAASHGGIDDIRDIRERVYFAPVDAKTKVYIVDEAHQLTTRAWDAFLKTLEEPPPRTVFVLATTEAHRVPATIISRCQRFDLRRIPQGRMQEHLETVARAEGIDLEQGVAERLARLARGSLRDGISTLEQVAAFGGTPVTMEATRNVLGLVRGDALRSYLDSLSVGNGARALQLLEDVSEEGADLRQFLDEVLSYLRGVLLARSGAVSALEGHFGPEERGWLGELAQRWSPGQILSILRAFGEIESRGREEHHVLVRTELVTAWCVGLVERSQALPVVDGRTPDPPQITSSTALVESPSPSTGGGDAGALPQTQSPVGMLWLSEQIDQAPGVELPSTADTGRPLDSGVRGTPVALSPPPQKDSEPEKSGSDLRAPSPMAESPFASVQISVPPPPSLAGLQTQWPTVLERFQGSLSARMRLRSVEPIALEDHLVTLAGPIDQLDLQRLDTLESRGAIEALLREATGLPFKVRFRQAGSDAPGPARNTATSLAELGSSLFGGSLISE